MCLEELEDSEHVGESSLFLFPGLNLLAILSNIPPPLEQSLLQSVEEPLGECLRSLIDHLDCFGLFPHDTSCPDPNNVCLIS